MRTCLILVVAALVLYAYANAGNGGYYAPKTNAPAAMQNAAAPAAVEP